MRPSLRMMLTFLRLEVAQMPMVLASLAPAPGALPSAVSCVVGISRAMECTLYPARPSCAAAQGVPGVQLLGAPPVPAFGRRLARSKMPPRST